MEVRYATDDDIGAIVELLKKSLGEELMPKTETYWRWKHIDNPFGKSPVLLAFDAGKLIGVRAFMCWKWRSGRDIMTAVRAVDTATHPDYQGKGIFRKLTLALLDKCKDDGVGFVFNTPNKASKPGYLKMGWQEAGVLPIGVTIQRPVTILRNVLTKPANLKATIKDGSMGDVLEHPGLDDLIKKSYSTDAMVTSLSRAYLKWRYVQVPVASYFALADCKAEQLNALLIGRIKNSRIGRELRIADFLANEKHSMIALVEQLREVVRSSDIDYTTISGRMSREKRDVIGKLNWKAKVGPTVTIRTLSLPDLRLLQDFSNWSPSLGDLELF